MKEYVVTVGGMPNKWIAENFEKAKAIANKVSIASFGATIYIDERELDGSFTGVWWRFSKGEFISNQAGATR